MRRVHSKQRGTVIIIVLWTSVLLTVLVTAMASKVRLSAKTAVNNQDASVQWIDVMSTLNQAEMELMMERMPRPLDEPQEFTAHGVARTPAFRFNGTRLVLEYPQPDGMVVRVYDHAGKINLNRIPLRNMQQLIEKRLGGEDADPEKVQDLLAAWTDWTDLNDQPMFNGAEKDYYQDQELPFTPRNNPELDTVEEILNIRGFAELFDGVNLDAAFTIYGNTRTVNLNLATREAMQLLPGLDDELIENILAYRELYEIQNRADIGDIVPFEQLQELSPWVGNSVSSIYSVFVYPKLEMDAETLALLQENDPFVNPDLVTQAYMEIVEVRSYNALPIVYKVDPYGRLPDTAAPRVDEDDYLFRLK